MGPSSVVNVHRVRVGAPAAEVGLLLDRIGGPEDDVWPGDRWPPIEVQRPLQPGARGRHGPIRYTVEAHVPGRLLTFRFVAPAGFVGGHRFVVTPDGDSAWFEHRLEIEPRGWARLAWPLVFRPLHDALAADAITNVRRALGEAAPRTPWTAWVRVLRWAG